MTVGMRYLMLSGLAMLAGCISFKIEDPSDRLETDVRVETASVKATRFDGIQAKCARHQDNRADFSIVCSGMFELEQVRTTSGMRHGWRKVSVGLFPGFDDYSAYVEHRYYTAVFMVPIANAIFAGVPTLASLFYAPFNDYGEKGICLLGIIGCYKDISPWEKRFEDKERISSTVESFALSDYEISVDGTTYRCPADATTVSIPVPRGGKTVTVKILSVPSLGGELGGYVDSLAGHELEVGIEKFKPEVTIKAILDGKEVDATVVSGLKSTDKKTPVVVDLYGMSRGATFTFGLEYNRHGTMYKGSGSYTVSSEQKGELVIELQQDMEQMLREFITTFPTHKTMRLTA